MSFTSQESVISNQTFGKDASFKLPQLIGSMSISPSGRDVVLGSKEGLHVIDLDSPYSPPRFLPHRTSWEVADVQWSPFADRDYWVVSTSNQKALVWNLNLFGWRNSIQHVLHGHTRAITDINFSAHHPDKLATCAVDSFVHCWDLRVPERPVVSFSNWFAGATQVKWSRQDENVVASAHDRFLHIWDIRKGAIPARTIEAHKTKIYGIDWNRFEPSKIVTCSLDKTIKFWDTSNTEDIPERVIETSFPVWRARHTPFGWGLMVMPQRGSGDLHLYDRRSINGKLESGRVKPVHTFPGHQGNVKEFLWRFYGTVKDGIDHRDFQLVSWGTDHELKLHAVDKGTFEDVGYEKGVSKPQRLRFTRRGAKYRTFRDEPYETDAILGPPGRSDSFPSSNQFLRAHGRRSTNMGMSKLHLNQWRGGLSTLKRSRNDMHGKGATRPGTDAIAWMKNVKIASWDTDALADEVTQTGDKFKNVDFENIDLSHRRVTLWLQSSWGEEETSSAYTRVDLKFPKDYPRDSQAIVYVQKTNSITPQIQQKLTIEARQIAEAYKLKGRGCIEAIIRYLLREQTLEEIISWIMRDSLTESKLLGAVDTPLDASDDSDDDQIPPSINAVKLNAQFNVPHPKGCAAIWAENGMLVCFFKKKDDEPTSFLASLGTANLGTSGSGKLFGGFGNLQVDSLSGKAQHTSDNKNGTSEDESDDSSVFSSSSSSSESSFGFDVKNRFVPLHRTTLDSLQRVRSGDGSQKSATMSGGKPQQGASTAILHIYDLHEIVTIERNTSERYRVDKDWAAAIAHNYDIVKHQPESIATQCWKLVFNMVDSTHQLEMRDPSTVHRDIPELDELLMTVMQSLEVNHETQQLATFAAIYLQRQQTLLGQLDQYLQSMAERTQDQGPQLGTGSGARPGLRSTVSYQTSRTGSFLSGGTAQQRNEVANDLAEGFSSSMPTANRRATHFHSTRNSSGAPSVVAHDPSGRSSTVHSSAVSLAGSPESNRTSKASFLSGIPGLYHNSRSRPGSPPQTSKSTGRLNVSSQSTRASPDDGFLSEARSKLKTSMSLMNVSRATHSGTKSGQDAKVSDSRHISDTFSRSRRRTRMNTQISVSDMKKQMAAEPLSIQEWLPNCERCVGYIQQYIPQLEVWQLWSQKAEMMNVCVTAQKVLKQLPQAQLEEAQGELARLPEQGLRICLRCIHCGRPAKKEDQASLGWQCNSSTCSGTVNGLSSAQTCSICEVQITGLTVPCLRCKHTTCYSCATIWFSNIEHVDEYDRSRLNSTTSKSGSGYGPTATGNISVHCPTGCGCQCNAVESFIVEEVEVETLQSVVDGAEAQNIHPSNNHHDRETSRPVLQENRRLHRGYSIDDGHGLVTESAIHALLALQNQSRHRSTSSTVNKLNAQANAFVPNRSPRARGNSLNTKEELHSQDEPLPILAKGWNAGLSRALSTKGSDATIRRSAHG